MFPYSFTFAVVECVNGGIEFLDGERHVEWASASQGQSFAQDLSRWRIEVEIGND